MHLRLLLLFICACHAQHMCKRSTSCRECIISGCIWYKRGESEWCDYSKIHRSIYKTKVRSERFCESSKNFNGTVTLSPYSIQSTTEKILFDTTNEVEMTILPNDKSTDATTHAPLDIPENRTQASSPPPLIEQESATTQNGTRRDAAFEQKSEKEILYKIRKHECQLFASVRRLRRFRMGKPLTRCQFKHAVKQCLRNSI